MVPTTITTFGEGKGKVVTTGDHDDDKTDDQMEIDETKNELDQQLNEDDDGDVRMISQTENDDEKRICSQRSDDSMMDTSEKETEWYDDNFDTIFCNKRKR